MTAFPETIMWEGTVRSLSLREQIRATKTAGFDKLSTTPLKYIQSLLEGFSSEDMLQLAADSGIGISHLDPLCRWCRQWKPENIIGGGMPLAFFSFSVDDFLRIASTLKVESLTAMTVAPHGSMSVDEMTGDFAALCDRAADYGIRCDLEFIPLDWAIPDLATAWTIVRNADRKNSGLTFDFWHFVRSGLPFELLRTIPGDKISCVQLADGLAHVPAHRSKFQDCLEDRVPPGAGEFPISAILQTLKDIGGLRRVGPEVFSCEFDAMSADDIAVRCRETLVQALDSVGIRRTIPQ
ncbi:MULTISPECIES: sugar phosphate isomerase/epimerase family protein [Rhizobium]|uniref:Xylose isomerase domain protein n=1 Tax=Rhizobium rhizogenes (strain K84 / ATCC BAA-868) TaxID=311403 RepID=B9JMN0_RHIR8|nr:MULTISPECIES: sugar phosphate isomerase/epimerase [Rhizobium]ACM28811.1 Xylose isomerase domain protein [Rhizobium rhizogenes K84]EJK88108.1 sugar phosphate isomerase/epimerase [Rhizobium sp. AP16]NTI43803.1 sugar phosphate isomerase/epimerase [Rhizobium rhizogenes]OCJ18928.1 xylose isomerase [Agrobacterium sp. B131/95]